MTLNDFEPPPKKKIKGFSNFLAISGCDAHFKGEVRRNGWR